MMNVEMTQKTMKSITKEMLAEKYALHSSNMVKKKRLKKSAFQKMVDKVRKHGGYMV